MIFLTTNPARLRAWRGFCVLGRSYLTRISGDDPARVKSHSAAAMTQYLIWYAADLETMIRDPAHDYPDIS